MAQETNEQMATLFELQQPQGTTCRTCAFRFRAKILEKEVADLKVPESRQNRHLRDELHKVRLECQQAWEKANEEMAENKELRERIKHLEADRR